MLKQLLLVLTLLVTVKLYGVSIITAEVHNPPRTLVVHSQAYAQQIIYLPIHIKNYNQEDLLIDQ
ncbi:hypothetical protein [Halobacillus sp. A5]|uniref:hypothetical protein n=1 Tax=Halobacillus sp. A5 TaxID=2880263 RepID=UPI0020A6330E|nr:hypothetical protein [Halobacillus sp. A5]MCP3026552.1 hypothetical protein [Halobacillus sp. A5]